MFSWSIKKNGGQKEQALGRSQGDFNKKIHIAVDALGNPLRFILSQGQAHESPYALDLIDGLKAEAVIGDKGYDSTKFIQHIEQKQMLAIIPPRRSRKDHRDYDKHRYKERHLVECFLNKIKHYRRIFSRFDKLAKRYLAFIYFVSTLVWLR